MVASPYQEYHPLAERLWSSILVDDEGRHELPPALEKATYVVMRRISSSSELAWLYGSVYSLYAAMMRQGEQQAADALFRVAYLARKLALESADSWNAGELRPLALPPLERPKLGRPDGESAVPLLSIQPRRA